MTTDLETFDMIQLIKFADMIGWDENRLLLTCHNLLILDDSLDDVFGREFKLQVVRD